MSRPVAVNLDLAALVHNVRRIRAIAPQSKILAMVKANAYGHGLKPIALTLDALVEGFGVSCSEEALYLRQVGIKQRIVLMDGLFSKTQLSLLDKYQFDTVVYSQQQLDLLTQQKLPKPINVWIKINTGINQLGLSTQDFSKVLQICQACPWIKVVCVMTHFSSADELSQTTTALQIKKFADVTNGLNIEKSLANSAGILAYPSVHADWIRPGLMLYGVSPFADKVAAEYGLKPVMHLQSTIIATKALQAGDRVGYGGTWVAPDARRIGIVAVGYGDGYPHDATSGTPVLLNGKLVELVGKVSMDTLVIDLSTQPEAKQGDTVCLWGSGLPIEEVANSTSTFRYELLCGINRGQLIRVRTCIEGKNDAKKMD